LLFAVSKYIPGWSSRLTSLKPAEYIHKNWYWMYRDNGDYNWTLASKNWDIYQSVQSKEKFLSTSASSHYLSLCIWRLFFLLLSAQINPGPISGRPRGGGSGWRSSIAINNSKIKFLQNFVISYLFCYKHIILNREKQIP
jgi:hypothetical protein